MVSKKRVLMIGGWFSILLLLWWAGRATRWEALAEVLGKLEIRDLGFLLILNIGIFVLMSVRWWWILRSMGHPVAILRLARYRLTAFGINYFTPGPQFGGEPYQVWVLHIKEGLPLAVSTSAVAFDKLIELIANFSFLAVGFWIIVRFGFLPASQGWLLLSLTIPVIIALCLYVLALWKNLRPALQVIARVDRLSEKSPFWAKVFQTIIHAEHHAGQAIRDQPGLFMISLFFSAGTWVALILEYRLALNFLGLTLAIPETIGVLTAARIAFLFPFPGGLGSLEISQVYAIQALGAGAAIGISMSLLIRARDVLFGGFGLILGGIYLRKPIRIVGTPGALRLPFERSDQPNTSDDKIDIPQFGIQK